MELLQRNHQPTYRTLPRGDGLKPTADSPHMEFGYPRELNGKFMGVGNGGFADPYRGLAPTCPRPFDSATRSAPTRHQDQAAGQSVILKMIDFAYRSTHEMTLKAKQLVKAFYDKCEVLLLQRLLHGRPHGCEAQRYPDDYDASSRVLANRHIHMWTSGFARSIDLSSSEGPSAEKATREPVGHENL